MPRAVRAIVRCDRPAGPIVLPHQFPKSMHAPTQILNIVNTVIGWEHSGFGQSSASCLLELLATLAGQIGARRSQPSLLALPGHITVRQDPRQPGQRLAP